MAAASPHPLVIVDARSQASVLANAVQGRGTESLEGYKAERLVYLNLPNMHAVREWLPTRPSGDGSLWWRGVERVREAAAVVADLVSKGHAVLVHCSDGWDRTPQLTSLAMILLLVDYGKVDVQRVASIVQREWIDMGHRFATRHSHHMPVNLTTSDTESSPIFLQFLDCLRTLPSVRDGDNGGLMGFVDELERDSHDPHGPFRGDCDRDRDRL